MPAGCRRLLRPRRLWPACRLAVAIGLAAAVQGLPWTAALAADEISRVRAMNERLQEALDEGLAKSETLRELVDMLQRSDLIVMICPQVPAKDAIWGELHFVASTPDVRYLRVRVRQHLDRTRLASIVAHELQHAAEVAAAPEVVDTKTMTALYDRIGFEIVHGQYETEAARAIAERVRREIVVNADAQPSRKH